MHDLDWDDLRVFLAAARLGSFSRAATRLGIRQSTVSRRIQALETAVGGAVFLRGKAGLLPTARGAALIEGATAMEAAATRVATAAAGAEAAVEGEVRLAVAPGLASLWVAPHLATLLAQHPGLRVELVVSLSIADLTRREADLALRFAQPVGADLVGQRVGALPYAVLAHPRWRDAPWTSLPWVAFTVPGFTAPEEVWTRAHGRWPPVLRTADYDAALAAVEAGVGAMVASRALVERGRTVVLEPPAPLPPPMPLWLVAHAATRHTPRVDAVWRAVVGWPGP